MVSIIQLLLVWFVISIPVAFFVAAIFMVSKDDMEVDEPLEDITHQEI